ncbi:unnamed protein product, partial [marine sediment metagenome]
SFKKKIAEIENEQAQWRNKPFPEWDKSEQAFWIDAYSWPPWKFNDLVGFIDIGTDGGNCVTADLYIKRKYFPKSHPSI